MSAQACAHCRFSELALFQRSTYALAQPNRKVVYSDGTLECRRHAPTVGAIRVTTSENHQNAEASWPVVRQTDWCGDWTADWTAEAPEPRA
jgi:hypothetical protein